MLRSYTLNRRIIRRLRRQGITVLTRAQWGSQRQDVYKWRRKNKAHFLLPAHPVDTVWQHITVTEPSGDFKRDCQTVERIGFDRFSTGCSYNFLVDMKTGAIAFGQPLAAKGSHTVNEKHVPHYSYDQNGVAIAIAVIGMPDNVLSTKAEISLAMLLRALIKEDAVTESFDYNPHSMVANKDCCCDETRDKMNRIRARAVKGMT